MVTMWGRYIDDIDRRVGRQLFVTVVDLRGAVSSGELACPIRVAGRNGMKTNVAGQPEGAGKFIGDFSGADDPPAILLHAAK